MGKFFLDNETERVTFEDGQWVDIKQELTQADSDYIMSQMAKGQTFPMDDKSAPRLDLNLGRLPLLERSIIAWSFTDDSGKPVSINIENISHLRSKYRTVILERVDSLNTEARRFSKNS